jgi:diadenosine tetraphosphatase ApaH/serine/threonine PP2A family protein phosphatase
MKIAILSCIHGNMPAFNAVLQDLDQQGCQEIYCLGDLVGYGPHPNQVVEKIRHLEITTVQGCWDEDIVEGLNACECSYPSLLAEKRGKLAHEWTNKQITPENRNYLAQLPEIFKLDNLCFVHGSPQSNHEYLLAEMDAFTALERVLSVDTEVLFCGHTHIPYIRTLDAGNLQIKVHQPDGEQLRQFTTPVKRIINVGSVGEPRHGRPNATYVIYDRETGTVQLREVEYNYQETCQAILESGLPSIFAWRLAKGLEYAEKADDPSHICER